MIEVVAALLWDGDKFLICQRPADKSRGLLWEFAGGKVERGETKEQALVRECREELDVTLSVGGVFMEAEHSYSDVDIRLTLFHAAIKEGTPQRREHNDIRWITWREIGQYDFCPADSDFIERIAADGVASEVHARLFSMGEAGYRDFQCRLMPTVDPGRVIGVRMPALRRFAQEYASSPEAVGFMKLLPHTYYEENNLHALLIEKIRDYRRTVEALDAFLPFVDNWATCDTLTPAVAPEDLPRFYEEIMRWMQSEHIYTVRFAIGMLLRFYLGEHFRPEMLQLVAGVTSQEYYVNMMIAWYFATALAKRYRQTLPWLQQARLARWTHNKAIQKAIESRRLTESQKEELRALKLKS